MKAFSSELNDFHPFSEDDAYPTWSTNDSCPPIKAGTGKTWAHFLEIFDDTSWAPSPDYIEILWNCEEPGTPAGGIRGTLLFDGDGCLIVHVVHSVLDQNGDISRLTHSILTHFGVSEDTLQEIQEVVRKSSVAISLRLLPVSGRWVWRSWYKT
jgi:hypothetical protein